MAMIPDAYVRKVRAESISGRLNATHDNAHIQRHLVWMACVSASLLSTRYLLVERNMHYPQRLYFNQLAFTGLLALRPFFGRGIIQWPFRRKLRPWRSRSGGTTLIIASMCFMYLSTMCLLQAILHFYNLPVLVMITPIAMFAEDVVRRALRSVSVTYADMLLTCVLLLASVGLLLTEYRITVPGLVTGILTMVFAGVARGLWKTALMHQPDVLANNVNQASLHVIAGVLVGALSATIFGVDGHIFAFGAGNGLLLSVNAVSTAMAMKLGKSMVLPVDDEVANTSLHTIDAPVYHIFDALTLAVFAGIAGCYSTLLTRRSYANIYQFCCFWLAMMCIGSRAWSRVPPARLPNTRFAHNSYGRMRSSSITLSLPTKPLPKYLVGISVASLWIAYGILNFTERREPRMPVTLDRNYIAQIPMEIVISMYKEPLGGIATLLGNLKRIPALSDAQITIYVKDGSASPLHIQSQLGANQVVALPNIGREGETYLNHILRRWDTLAQQTLFLQAEIHNPREFYTRIHQYLVRSRTGFLDLAWVGTLCDCHSCSDRLLWSDSMHFIPQTWWKIHGTAAVCNHVLLSYKGQFAVSAARIRGVDKRLYEDMWRALVDEGSWAHREPFLNGRPDEMSAPDFGYTVERVWSLVFQCSGRDVAWRCASMVSRWRIGGGVEDCQCLDE